MLVLMPLQFGSSIFAPTDHDAGLAAGVHQGQPAVQPGRRLPATLINGGAVAHSVWMTLVWSVGITAVTAPLAVARFRKKA